MASYPRRREVTDRGCDALAAVRWSQVSGSVRAMLVVVIDVLGEDCLQMGAGENEQMVEVLPPEYAAEYLAWTKPADIASRMASAPTRPERIAAAE